MRTRRTLLFLLLATTATVSLTALLHIAVTPSAVADAEKPETRLLLKCPTTELDAVLKALQGRDVQLWDLDTMKRVHAPVPAERIPRLPDAHKLMLELLTTLQCVKGKNGQSLVRVTEMAIQPRRATVKITSGRQADFDAARKALAGNLYVKGRSMAGPETGAMQTMPDGRYRMSFSFRFKEDAPGGGPKRPSIANINMADIERAALPASMSMVYASAISRDPNRARGYETVAREFTFAAATLTQLKALVHNISVSKAGLTVFELRWKLAPDKEQSGHPFDRITKPVVRVGGRAPLRR